MTNPYFPSEQLGVFLPGDSTAILREYAIPSPGPKQILLKVGASGICGSDIGYIYRGYKTHKGLNDQPAYQGVIAGHEPSGTIVAVGSKADHFSIGGRVIVYHIVGCGECRNCRSGYYISCSNTATRAAYGWQRDGGHSKYLLAEESSAILLPDELTLVDGSLIACGFGTAWEGLRRSNLNGADTLLVIGLGPVGLATAMIGRALGAQKIVGVEKSPERIKFVSGLGLLDDVIALSDSSLEEILAATDGHGCDVSVDCSGSQPGRSLAIEGTAEWGRVSLLGEGGGLATEVSDLLLHKNLTINASWVTSLQGMEDLANLLASKKLHPEIIVSDRFPLADCDEAYKVAASAASGKVIILPNL